MRCRHWAERYGSILIVCGPILEGDHHDTIGSNHIVVPEAFFKVVVTLDDEPKGVGFICPNTDQQRASVSYVLTPTSTLATNNV